MTPERSEARTCPVTVPRTMGRRRGAAVPPCRQRKPLCSACDCVAVSCRSSEPFVQATEVRLKACARTYAPNKSSLTFAFTPCSVAPAVGISRNQCFVLSSLITPNLPVQLASSQLCPAADLSLRLGRAPAAVGSASSVLRQRRRARQRASPGPSPPLLATLDEESDDNGDGTMLDTPMVLAPVAVTRPASASSRSDSRNSRGAATLQWVPVLAWAHAATHEDLLLRVSFLRLFVAMCECRNYFVMSTLWDVFPFEPLLACLKLSGLHDCGAGALRGAYVCCGLLLRVRTSCRVGLTVSTLNLPLCRYCDLMLKLYVDCKPQYLVTPVHFTRNWNDLCGNKAIAKVQQRSDEARRSSVAVPTSVIKVPPSAPAPKARAGAGAGAGATVAPSSAPTDIQFKSSAGLPDLRRDSRLRVFLVQYVATGIAVVVP